MSLITFFPPRDAIAIDANDERIFTLADRLWERTADHPRTMRPISIRVAVHSGPPPDRDAERHIVWTHGEREYTVHLAGVLRVRIRIAEGEVEAGATDGLIATAPALAARTILEAPAAVLLSRRAFTVLHAAAVVGRHGAVVIRGASGAGKSTLTAAVWRAGYAVLADESLLVARDDHDDLAACVRDLTLRPNATSLLSLRDAEVAFSGGEEKRRVDLYAHSSPSARRARRIATLLLGDRSPGPARLQPLSHSDFQDAFRRGTIPQEHAAIADRVSESWSRRNSYRLDGAIDLTGAVGILREFLD